MNNMENVYFNEFQFTEVCKTGFLNKEYVSKSEMIGFIKNGFIIKKFNKIFLPKLEHELLKGIIKRSPLFSDIDILD
jgi:hypothetical protein